MIVINTPVSPYLQNAPIVYCDKTKKSIFVDPGDEAEKLISVSEEHNLKPEQFSAGLFFCADSISIQTMLV